MEQIKKATKIIATLGPSTDTKEKISSLIKNGVSVFRLNFSHGNHEYFSKIIKIIRKLDSSIGILLDTKGPELRISEIKNGSILIKKKERIIFCKKKKLGTTLGITLKYSDFSQFKKGDVMLFDDGLLQSVIVKKSKDEIICEFKNSGTLFSNKSVTVKNRNLPMTFLSTKDKDDIIFGIKHNVDFIAASFVRSKEDCIAIRNLLKKHKSGDTFLISKIEHSSAVANFKEILEHSDGIMIARGDLGVEMDLIELPQIQEQLITNCNTVGKPVIVATQMLESMKDFPRPTRAEINDVSQAILQGTDGIMLSAETAMGKYPIAAVKMMSALCEKYDPIAIVKKHKMHSSEKHSNLRRSQFISKSAYESSIHLDVETILISTRTGFTARQICKFKPMVPLYAIVSCEKTFRQLQLSWGIQPILVSKSFFKSKDFLKNVIKGLVDEKKLKMSSLFTFVSGFLENDIGKSSVLHIHTVEELLNK